MNTQIFFVGVVEDRQDPLKLGRLKVRVVGLHTHDKTLLPTKDLPWAVQLNSGSASMNGIGTSPTAYVEGSTVIVVYADTERQSPIILGSLIGIPQENSKLIDKLDDEEPIELGEDVTSTEVEDTPVSESPTEVDPTILSKPVNINGGVGALNQAMDEAGITSKYARASVLGICQVESNFKPSAENLNYSAAGLISTFPSIFKNDANLAKSVERKPQNIAEIVYGPIKGKGKQLGNDVVGDGWRYRGRGYVQLTGKANYLRYSSVAGSDLVTNPDLLLDENIAAKVTVQYFKDRVKTSQDSPSYINSAIKAVGLNRADILEKKINAYQYWLGESGNVTQTDKTTDSGKSQEQHKKSKMVNGIPQDKVNNLSYGFSDPNFKYPLKAYLKEPDTNRLARGKFTNTIVSRKDKSKLTAVPIAGGGTWNQPAIPFNALYPYNHVYESESGHVQEFDDTPGNERLHTYHRKGTFEEIDSNGSKVIRVVGDNYEIIDRNGFVYVFGNMNLTVTGNINIITQSNANVTVNGNANINIHGDANTNVGGNSNNNITGSFKVKASDIILESTGLLDIKSSGNMKISGSRIDLNNGSRSSGLGSSIEKLKSINPDLPVLGTPERNADKTFIFESPEELVGTKPPIIKDAMPEKQSAKTEKIKNNAPAAVVSSCEQFKSMEEFPNSLVLHTDGTGYSWTLGTVLRGNKLGEITVKGKRYLKSDIVCNLKQLCVNVLGKINETVGQVGTAWVMSSCYRNSIPSGGSATSQHLIGAAVDISLGTGPSNQYESTHKWAKIFAETLQFDQLLYEFKDEGFRKNWIHISYLSSANRKQVLTFLNSRTAAQGIKKLA